MPRDMTGYKREEAQGTIPDLMLVLLVVVGPLPERSAQSSRCAVGGGPGPGGRGGKSYVMIRMI